MFNCSSASNLVVSLLDMTPSVDLTPIFVSSPAYLHSLHSLLVMTLLIPPISDFRKVFNIAPDDLTAADKAEETSIFCQPCKRTEEFRRAVVYCRKCETKFCSEHQKVCSYLHYFCMVPNWWYRHQGNTCEIIDIKMISHLFLAIFIQSLLGSLSFWIVFM